jgi:hypothetical protein
MHHRVHQIVVDQEHYYAHLKCLTANLWRKKTIGLCERQHGANACSCPHSSIASYDRLVTVQYSGKNYPVILPPENLDLSQNMSEEQRHHRVVLASTSFY